MTMTMMTMIINCNQGTQVRLSNELELLSSSPRESACYWVHGKGPMSSKSQNASQMSCNPHKFHGSKTHLKPSLSRIQMGVC